MSGTRPVVNIVNASGRALFTPHFDPARDGYDVVENGGVDREYDLLIVFEAMLTPSTYRVRAGRVLFVSGEPPEIGGHPRGFLRQFDAIFSAKAPPGSVAPVSHEQHFNNWHFGYSAARGQYRYSNAEIRALQPPQKTAHLSTITSNLNYLPMHIKRRALIDRLAKEYADNIEIFGRPHRFIEYKEDAIIPYRFHLCVENCSVPGLWTEKIADALLGYAVPVYAGCPDIERYFPGATIAIDLNDYVNARRTIDHILNDGEALYRSHLDAVIEARRCLIEDFDISALVRDNLERSSGRAVRSVSLLPEDRFPFSGVRKTAWRIKSKARAIAWRQWIRYRG